MVFRPEPPTGAQCPPAPSPCPECGHVHQDSGPPDAWPPWTDGVRYSETRRPPTLSDPGFRMAPAPTTLEASGIVAVMADRPVRITFVPDGALVPHGAGDGHLAETGNPGTFHMADLPSGTMVSADAPGVEAAELDRLALRYLEAERAMIEADTLPDGLPNEVMGEIVDTWVEASTFLLDAMEARGLSWWLAGGRILVVHDDREFVASSDRVIVNVPAAVGPLGRLGKGVAG